ncbi:unnamed protein product [Blepharisma stoltei]|uniref:RCC1-like domain-containing protein n=1 Tax=Blepharisma stoltei TaxID=1481888 RepID=A0AAU9IFP1_9CILI|nr:unnamed protein product [Blepharisma stoltei]
MLKRIGCGLNHSVCVLEDGSVYVWGLSKNDELGVPELKGFAQYTPYSFDTSSDESHYSAIEVAVGDTHTALLIRDVSLPPLKLIYSAEIPISKIFNQVLESVKTKCVTMSNYHTQKWKGAKAISREKVAAFFNEFLTNENEEIIQEITDLLMTKADQNGKILYKELRDQLYGFRVDDGRVMTWGCKDNGRLGRGDPREMENSKERLAHLPEEISITKISCGGQHTLAISMGRKLFSWGANAYGQLGTGNTKDQFIPVQVTIEAEYLVDIAGGGSHSLALDNEGNVYSWGLGEGGRLGHGESNLELFPRKIRTLDDVESIAAGHSHSGCIRKGEIYTWGVGTYARLGHGTLNNEFSPRALDFFKGRYMWKLCLSFFHSAVLAMNGEVWAWGNSKNGRLGVPSSSGENQLIPVRVGMGTMMGAVKIVDVALGYKHGLALSKRGQLFAWGDGLDGKLGINSKALEEPIPKEVKLPKVHSKKKEGKLDFMPLKSTAVSSVYCGDFNSYCLTNAGEVLAWGSNAKGQLGNKPSNEPDQSGDEIEEDEPEYTNDIERTMPRPASQFKGRNSYTPLLMDVFRKEKFRLLASSGEYVLALGVNGKVWAWGTNEQGQLGIGYSESTRVIRRPVMVAAFKRIDIKLIAAGPYHSAFLADNGEVYMTGSAEYGKLGLGDGVLTGKSSIQYIPRMVLGLPNVKNISCGVTHTAALDYSHHLWVWGSGWFGKLGLSDAIDRVVPTLVDFKTFQPPSQTGLKEVACGEHYTLVLSLDGYVYGAGLAKFAGLQMVGSNEAISFQRVVKIASAVKAISAGRDHSLAVTKRGQIYGWGKVTSGKLGPGPFVYVADDPTVALPGQLIMSHDTVFERAVCGSNHSCALTVDGDVFVWGSTGSGRLGLAYIDDPEIKVPQKLYGVNKWLSENKEIAETQVDDVEEGDNEYFLQTLIKNEPAENSEETLLLNDQKIISKLDNLLMMFDKVREVELERTNSLSYLESLIVAKIEKMPQVGTPLFKLTLPPIISKNIQLYEYLLGCLQSHPCYLGSIIEKNPNLPSTQLADIINGIYGNMKNDPIKMRRLMLLYKIALTISVGKSDFKRSLKVKASDIASEIYFKLLRSQPTNIQFISGLAAEIMKLVYKASKNSVKKDKPKVVKEVFVRKPSQASSNKGSNEENKTDEDHGSAPEAPPQDEIRSQPEEIKSQSEEDPQNIRMATNEAVDHEKHMDENRVIDESIPEVERMKIKDALNYKQLEELGELPYELQIVLKERISLFKKTAGKARKLIYQVLSHSPKVRKRFSATQKLSNEVKFMYKDIPSVFLEHFPSQCNTIEGKAILDSKIVSLFFLPLVELLKEPYQLKRMGIEEFNNSFRKKGAGPKDEAGLKISFNEFITLYGNNVKLIAEDLEKVAERAQGYVVDFDEYRKSLVDELINVPDLNLQDLSLADLFTQCLAAEDPNLTIKVCDIASIHLLLLQHLDILKESFSEDDPVVLIIESFGDITELYKKILKSDTKDIKMNLNLPIRWLLRERGIQTCPKCKSPLTYSLLKNKPPEDRVDEPTTVTKLWNCWSCGNTQDGWHMKCLECEAVRREFPIEALINCFRPFYNSKELLAFVNILHDIPRIPPKITPHKFMKNIVEKDKSDFSMAHKINGFFRSILDNKPIEKTEDEAIEDAIKDFEIQAKHEYDLRTGHRAYLDSINQMLLEVEEEIRLGCNQFQQNTRTILKQASLAIKTGKNTSEVKFNDASTNKRAQGRFNIDYLKKKKILINMNVPPAVMKNTIFLFTETETGSFDVKVVLVENRNYICLPRAPIEVKLMGFEIEPDKLKAMRRTMNFRAETSFLDGKVSFNVFQLVRLLGSLLGKCKQE